MQVETVLHAAWVIPVAPPGAVLPEHSLAIDAGRIAAILPAAEARESIQARESISLPGHALLPGLINAHTHAAMSLLRGLADDMPLQDWLTKHIWPAEQRHVSAGFVRDGARLAVVEMLRGGTSCFNDMYFFPGHAARAALALGMRVVMGLIVIDSPSPWAQDAHECLRKGLAARDELKDQPLFRSALAPHAPYSVSDAALRQVAVLADELDAPVHIHVHETRREVQECAVRPLARLEQLGLVNERLLAVHATQLNEQEIASLARCGCHVAHCPESNLKLASGICPVQRLLDAGVNVCLGTDGAASNNDLDMLGEMRSASFLAKGAAMDPAAVDARCCLEMATIAGARALGLERETGSLEEGKAADVLAIDLSWPETQPVHDPVSQIVYAASRAQVSDLWIAGVRRLRRGQVQGLDQDELLARVGRWRERIAAAS